MDRDRQQVTEAKQHKTMENGDYSPLQLNETARVYKKKKKLEKDNLKTDHFPVGHKLEVMGPR